jgi:nicotinamide mononucleotide transporter
VPNPTLMGALELLSVLFALAYLGLAIRQSNWCWPAALVSVLLALVVFFDAKLYMESALQIFYFAMGVYGWMQWQHGGAQHDGVRVHWWPARTHAVTMGSIAAGTAGFAWLLARATDSPYPFLDSFTTVGAIVTTFMVTRKVIENWIYWLVIDSVLVYLCLQRGLYWYAGLYVLYLGMCLVGFRSWLSTLREVSARRGGAMSRGAGADGSGVL